MFQQVHVSFAKNYKNQKVFDFIRASGISMKSETLCHQASPSKY